LNRRAVSRDQRASTLPCPHKETPHACTFYKDLCELALAAAILAGQSAGAQAKTCWPYGTVIATAGIAIKKDTARKFARINWRVKVRAIATLGNSYTNWDLAENRDYNCQKKLGTWRCSAVATPCRP
jgi:hypothetical protein